MMFIERMPVTNWLYLQQRAIEHKTEELVGSYRAVLSRIEYMRFLGEMEATGQLLGLQPNMANHRNVRWRNLIITVNPRKDCRCYVEAFT